MYGKHIFEIGHGRDDLRHHTPLRTPRELSYKAREVAVIADRLNITRTINHLLIAMFDRRFRRGAGIKALDPAVGVVIVKVER